MSANMSTVHYDSARECLRRAWYAFGVAEMLGAQGDDRGQAYVLDAAFMWMGAALRARAIARVMRDAYAEPVRTTQPERRTAVGP